MDYFKFKMQKWISHDGFKVDCSNRKDQKAFRRRVRRVVKRHDRKIFERNECMKIPKAEDKAQGTAGADSRGYG